MQAFLLTAAKKKLLNIRPCRRFPSAIPSLTEVWKRESIKRAQLRLLTFVGGETVLYPWLVDEFLTIRRGCIIRYKQMLALVSMYCPYTGHAAQAWSRCINLVAPQNARPSRTRVQQKSTQPMPLLLPAFRGRRFEKRLVLESLCTAQLHQSGTTLEIKKPFLEDKNFEGRQTRVVICLMCEMADTRRPARCHRKQAHNPRP